MCRNIIRALYVFAVCTSLPLANSAVPLAITDGFRIGGSSGEVALATAFDADGNLYIAGSTFGLGSTPQKTIFGPATRGHLFVIKIAASRQTISYVAEFGSSQMDDFGAFAVDAAGNAYLAGYTRGTDFPITTGAYESKAPQGGSFVLKLDPTGSRILYSTFLDQSPYTRIKALAVNASGNVYAAGMTDGLTFPTTAQAYLRHVPTDVVAGENTVGFVTELNQSGSALVFSTLLGGTYDRDWISSIALALDGTIHVAGRSYSKDFPITTGFSAQGQYLDNAFRARFDSDGSHLLYSTLVGGTNPLGLVLGAQGAKWLVENVNSAIFVMGWDALDIARGPGVVAADATVNSMIVLPNGHLILGGATRSPKFPTLDAIMPCIANLPHDANGSFDQVDTFNTQGFLMEIDETGKTVFSSFLGGKPVAGLGGSVTALALDPKGSVLVVGTGADPTFPGGSNLLNSQIPGTIFSFRLDLSQVAHGSPAPSCLVSGLTFASAPAVPGSFATLFGSNLGPKDGVPFALTTEGRVPTELGGTQLTVGGVAAPLLYAQDRQINFLVPQSITGSADVCIVRGTEKTCIFTYLASMSPAIFYVYGQGVFAILNQDGTLNTPQNPAERGSYISLFGAGFGGYTRMFADGAVTDLPLASLNQPVRAFFYDPRYSCIGIGGSCLFQGTYEGEVVFAGAAPLAVNGLTQINVKTPATPVPGTGRLDLIPAGQRAVQVTVSLK